MFISYFAMGMSRRPRRPFVTGVVGVRISGGGRVRSAELAPISTPRRAFARIVIRRIPAQRGMHAGEIALGHLDTPQRLVPTVAILASIEFDHEEQKQRVTDLAGVVDARDMLEVAVAIGSGDDPLPGTRPR